MIEIGTKAKEFRGEGSTIKGIVDGLDHNKIYIVAPQDEMDLDTANTIRRTETIPYEKWRIIGFGLLWSEASTANEDPVVEFGYIADRDAFGKMAATITGGEKFCDSDHLKYEKSNLLGANVITEDSATLVVTWTEGVKFNVWQHASLRMCFTEAAVPAMSSGKCKPYFLVEVDTGGKW